MVNFEKSETRKFYITFLHVINRITHACGICFNAIHLNAEPNYVNQKFLICGISERV